MGAPLQVLLASPSLTDLQVDDGAQLRAPASLSRLGAHALPLGLGAAAPVHADGDLARYRASLQGGHALGVQAEPGRVWDRAGLGDVLKAVGGLGGNQVRPQRRPAPLSEERLSAGGRRRFLDPFVPMPRGSPGGRGRDWARRARLSRVLKARRRRSRAAARRRPTGARRRARRRARGAALCERCAPPPPPLVLGGHAASLAPY